MSHADEAGRGRWLVAARVPPGRADLRALPRLRTHTLAQRAAWLQQCHPGPYLFIGKCSTWALKSNWTDRRCMRRLEALAHAGQLAEDGGRRLCRRPRRHGERAGLPAALPQRSRAHGAAAGGRQQQQSCARGRWAGAGGGGAGARGGSRGWRRRCPRRQPQHG